MSTESTVLEEPKEKKEEKDPLDVLQVGDRFEVKGLIFRVTDLRGRGRISAKLLAH